jgi:hypothetical protein
MKAVFLWLAAAVPGMLLIAASIGKLWEPADTITILGLVGVPPSAGQWFVPMLASLEAGLGTALFLGWHSRVMYILSIALLAAFMVFLLVLGWIDPSARCACFGRTVAAWTGGGISAGLLRNGLLIALLVGPTLNACRRRAAAGDVPSGAPGGERALAHR